MIFLIPPPESSTLEWAVMVCEIGAILLAVLFGFITTQNGYKLIRLKKLPKNGGPKR